MTNTDAHRQYNVKLPRLTQQQLSELAAATGMTTTQTVIVAIDRMHHQIIVAGETDRMAEHIAAQNASAA